MAKNQDGYLSAKESRRISKENRRITDQYEKQRQTLQQAHPDRPGQNPASLPE